MWRRSAFLLIVGLSLAPRSRAVGQEQEDSHFLLTDSNWVRFDVVMGRIVAVTSRAKQDRQRVHRELPDGATETLAVCIDRGLTSVQYTREQATERLQLWVVRRDSVEVRWTCSNEDGSPVTLSYNQSPGSDIQVSVEQPGQPERVWTAPSFWHLVALEPEVRDLRLIEFLQTLRVDWDPRRDAEAVVEALATMDPWQMTTTMQEVETLVAQLADADFHARQWADRELRSRGRSVLCLLNEVDLSRLDCEQRLRVREIRRSLAGDASDTPQRVAAWLVNDKQVWLALMNHPSLRHRQVAHAHLARILARPLDFQPDAELAVRREQLLALRTQLALR